MADGKMADQQWVRFGFRQIEAKDGKLWLNGKPIFLRGFNRHQDSPHTGMATDLETFRADVVAMKQAGANFLRPSIHPCDPGELDLCDELGILVHEGIPLNGWDGSAEGEESSRNTLQCAERQLKKMIRRDVNHPSVMFWSVSNENSETRPEVVKGDNALIQLGKRLDPTRLVVHVSERSRWIASKNHPLFEFDDVICLNAYPSELGRAWGFDPFGEYPSPKGGNPSYDFTESARFWKEAAEKLRAMYPGKPILVAEFGYPCFEKMQGSLGEDLQGRGIETEFKAIAASGFCGAAIWCYADHPWPSGGIAEYGFVSTSPYGVKSRDRKHVKAGFRVAEKSFREQGRRFAVQESS
jgi:beta-glucuronidase